MEAMAAVMTEATTTAMTEADNSSDDETMAAVMISGDYR